MKIKKNEVAIFNKVVIVDYGQGNIEKYNLSKLYFFNGSELGELRRNSKNLYFWDGNKHRHIYIKFSHIETFEKITDEELTGNDWKLNIDNTVLSRSNIQGECTPYYTEKKEISLD